MDSRTILVVDDEDAILVTLAEYLRGEGYDTVSASGAAEGKQAMEQHKIAAALVDIFMPDGSGLELLSRIKEKSPETEVIIMTSRASLDTAVEAIRKGAYAYLEKPFNNIDEVGIVLEKALEKRRLVLENRRLVEELTARNRELVMALGRKSSLIELGRALSCIHEIDKLLNYFIEVVVTQLKVNRASLMLIADDGQEMSIAASHGLDPEIVRTTRVRLGEGVAGTVAQTGKAILVRDVKNDPLTRESVRLAAASDSFISSPIVLSIPITLKDTTLGVINLTDKLSEEPFNEDDLDFLHGLAGQAAVAIDSARHIEELERSYSKVKEAQNQLVASERLNALGQMAAGVAHDFNNILSGILSHIEYLKMRGQGLQDPENVFGAELGMIETLTVQGAKTVQRIQEFAGLRKDRPETAVDINAVIRKTLDMTRPVWNGERSAKGAEIVVHTELGEIPATLGREFELVQLLSNLIFNAVEAMPTGGQLEVRSRLEDGRIALEVQDRGRGMSSEEKTRIFEPFFTTKRQGQGLGGSIVYGIVKRYGGELFVDSEPGRGTKVQVMLPVAAVSPESASENHPPPLLRRASGRILLVEDDEVNLESMRRNLRLLGYEVEAALSGAEALEMFKKEHSFDVVITDLSMPGFSGLQLARAIHGLDGETPIIMLSGFSVQVDPAETETCGIRHVLTKPCQIAEIQSAIESVRAH